MTIKRGNTVKLKLAYKIMIAAWSYSLYPARTHFTIESIEGDRIVAKMQSGKHKVKLHSKMVEPYSHPVYRKLKPIVAHEEELEAIVTEHEYLSSEKCINELVSIICKGRVKDGIKLLHDINTARLRESVALTDDSIVACKTLDEASSIFSNSSVSDNKFYEYVEHAITSDTMAIN